MLFILTFYYETSILVLKIFKKQQDMFGAMQFVIQKLHLPVEVFLGIFQNFQNSFSASVLRTQSNIYDGVFLRK